MKFFMSMVVLFLILEIVAPLPRPQHTNSLYFKNRNGLSQIASSPPQHPYSLFNSPTWTTPPDLQTTQTHSLFSGGGVRRLLRRRRGSRGLLRGLPRRAKSTSHFPSYSASRQPTSTDDPTSSDDNDAKTPPENNHTHSRSNGQGSNSQSDPSGLSSNSSSFSSHFPQKSLGMSPLYPRNTQSLQIRVKRSLNHKLKKVFKKILHPIHPKPHSQLIHMPHNFNYFVHYSNGLGSSVREEPRPVPQRQEEPHPLNRYEGEYNSRGDYIGRPTRWVPLEQLEREESNRPLIRLGTYPTTTPPDRKVTKNEYNSEREEETEEKDEISCNNTAESKGKINGNKDSAEQNIEEEYANILLKKERTPATTTYEETRDEVIPLEGFSPPVYTFEKGTEPDASNFEGWIPIPSKQSNPTRAKKPKFTTWTHFSKSQNKHTKSEKLNTSKSQKTMRKDAFKYSTRTTEADRFKNIETKDKKRPLKLFYSIQQSESKSKKVTPKMMYPIRTPTKDHDEKEMAYDDDELVHDEYMQPAASISYQKSIPSRKNVSYATKNLSESESNSRHLRRPQYIRKVEVTTAANIMIKRPRPRQKISYAIKSI